MKALNYPQQQRTTPLKTYLLLTSDRSHLFTRIFRRLTGSWFSHAALFFSSPPFESEGFYFENTSPLINPEGGGGWRGPYNIKRVMNWRAHKPQVRDYRIMRLPTYTNETLSMQSRAFDFVGKVSYSHISLPVLAFRMLFHTTFPALADNATNAICSETIARVLCIRLQNQLVQGGRFKYEDVLPSGHHKPALSHIAEDDPWHQSHMTQ